VNISSDTTVTIGLIVVCAGIVVKGIWWAAQMQTKVDAMLQLLTTQQTSTQSLETKHGNLDKKVDHLEARVIHLEESKNDQ
jgi:exosome complex RNA-binding protein Rrp4